MNRRSFLAALPLVPAALAVLRPARREPLIFGTVWKDGKWIAGNGTAETWREVEEPGRPRPIVYDELVPSERGNNHCGSP